MNIISLPFEGECKVPGASLGFKYFYKSKRLDLGKTVERTLNWEKYLSLNSYGTMREGLKQLLDLGDVLIWGGNHATTALVIHELLQKDNFPIIIFDAHNDKGDTCNKYYNWNMIDYIERHISRGILLGYRYYLDNMPESKKIEYITDVEMMDRGLIRTKIQQMIEEEEMVYVSVDLDVLNPSEFPGVGYPVAGGILLVQLLDFLRTIFKSKAKIIIDIVEYNPIVELECSVNVLERLIKEIVKMSGERGKWQENLQ